MKVGIVVERPNEDPSRLVQYICLPDNFSPSVSSLVVDNQQFFKRTGARLRLKIQESDFDVAAEMYFFHLGYGFEGEAELLSEGDWLAM